MEARWRDTAWLDEARRWIDDRLSERGRRVVGVVEQPHVTPWSTVLRVPTDAGPCWFKATMGALRHEAAVTALLADAAPDVVPPLLAWDPGTGWMLMADAGETLRVVAARERSLDRWRRVLPRYAALQQAMESRTDALLAAGVPDLRLASLPERYDELVRRLDVEPRFVASADRVGELCDELAAFGIPETIQHDDLHDAQVFVGPSGERVLDWGDACVAHPFLTLSVTIEGVIAWGLDDEPDSVDVAPYLDAYLAPYRDRDPGVAAAVAPALRLGWACRAVNGHVQGQDEQTRTRLRMFLDGRPG